MPLDEQTIIGMILHDFYKTKRSELKFPFSPLRSAAPPSANSLSANAKTQFDRGDFGGAIHLWQQAITQYSGSDIETAKAVASCHWNIGGAYRKLNEFYSALQAYNNCLSCLQQRKITTTTGTTTDDVIKRITAVQNEIITSTLCPPPRI